MKLLLHICCSNCAIYPLQTLFARNIEIRGFWFNPNIHPLTEYAARLQSLRQLQLAWELDIEYDDRYGMNEFLRVVPREKDRRCEVCYSLRLEATARTAKRMGFDGFTTTLLVSPYQKFSDLICAGEEAGKKYAVPFHAEDFRAGWKDGMNAAGKLGLYRQKYCGCMYSEMEARSKNRMGRRESTHMKKVEKHALRCPTGYRT